MKQFKRCLKTSLEFSPVIPFFTFIKLETLSLHTCSGSEDYCECNFDSGRHCYPVYYTETTPLTRYIERARVQS